MRMSFLGLSLMGTGLAFACTCFAQADQPVPRSDQNSLTAHAQLLDKARAGGIDVYFEGDSITRLEAELFRLECGQLRMGRGHDSKYFVALTRASPPKSYRGFHPIGGEKLRPQ